jgi:hypothetical protein
MRAATVGSDARRGNIPELGVSRQMVFTIVYTSRESGPRSNTTRVKQKSTFISPDQYNYVGVDADDTQGARSIVDVVVKGQASKSGAGCLLLLCLTPTLGYPSSTPSPVRKRSLIEDSESSES